MTLKQLEDAIAALRAKGHHPLTPIAVQDCDHSHIPVDRIEVDRGIILLRPSWIEAVDDDEEGKA